MSAILKLQENIGEIEEALIIMRGLHKKGLISDRLYSGIRNELKDELTIKDMALKSITLEFLTIQN